MKELNVFFVAMFLTDTQVVQDDGMKFTWKQIPLNREADYTKSEIAFF